MTEEPSVSAPGNQTQRREIIKGIALLAALHVLFVVGCLAVTTLNLFRDPYAPLAAAAFIGFFQFAYVIPAVIIARLMKRNGMLKGLLIGAAITFLLTGTCALLFKWGVLA